VGCNCNKAIPNTSCLANYTIGILDDNEDIEDYRCFFKTATGRTDVYPISLIPYTSLFYVESPKVRIGEAYEIWINRAGDATEKKIPFTITSGSAQIEVDCVQIEFTACFEGDNYAASVDQSIELE
jgi:hypothetical protein